MRGLSFIRGKAGRSKPSDFIRLQPAKRVDARIFYAKFLGELGDKPVIAVVLRKAPGRAGALPAHISLGLPNPPTPAPGG